MGGDIARAGAWEERMSSLLTALIIVWTCVGSIILGDASIYVVKWYRKRGQK